MRERLANEPALLDPVVDEVLRYDPPTHNTRRFLAEDGIVAGQAMKKGEAILVVLAAANHDPSVNPRPEKFDPLRKNRKTFTLGSGVHACPGGALAATIAKTGVEQLLASGVPFDRLLEAVSYRASANTRVPLFVQETQR